MQAMQGIETTSTEWSVFVQMRGMLLQAGTYRAPRQDAGPSHAGSDRAIPRESWPGCRVGVRAPRTGETPLSASEVGHAMMAGVL